MRALLIVVVFGVLALGAAQAQSAHTPYLGISVTILPAFDSVLPLLSFQAGTPVADFLEVRVKADAIFTFNLVEADLLIAPNFNSSFKPYLGAGAAVAFPGSFSYDGVATLGLEYTTGSVGFFGEAQAFLSSFVNGIIAPFFRVGVNFHL